MIQQKTQAALIGAAEEYMWENCKDISDMLEAMDGSDTGERTRRILAVWNAPIVRHGSFFNSLARDLAMRHIALCLAQRTRDAEE